MIPSMAELTLRAIPQRLEPLRPAVPQMSSAERGTLEIERGYIRIVFCYPVLHWTDLWAHWTVGR